MLKWPLHGLKWHQIHRDEEVSSTHHAWFVSLFMFIIELQHVINHHIFVPHPSGRVSVNIITYLYTCILKWLTPMVDGFNSRRDVCWDACKILVWLKHVETHRTTHVGNVLELATIYHWFLVALIWTCGITQNHWSVRNMPCFGKNHLPEPQTPWCHKTRALTRCAGFVHLGQFDKDPVFLEVTLWWSNMVKNSSVHGLYFQIQSSYV